MSGASSFGTTALLLVCLACLFCAETVLADNFTYTEDNRNVWPGRNLRKSHFSSLQLLYILLPAPSELRDFFFFFFFSLWCDPDVGYVQILMSALLPDFKLRCLSTALIRDLDSSAIMTTPTPWATLFTTTPPLTSCSLKLASVLRASSRDPPSSFRKGFFYSQPETFGDVYD